MTLTLAARFAAVVTIVGAAALASAAAATPDAIDYERAAVNYLERNGHTGATAETLTLEHFVQSEFLSAPIGVFEVAIPRRNLATPSEPARFQGICLNLLDAQLTWLDWARGKGKDTKDLRAEFDAVRDWIDGWDTKALAASAKDAAPTLHDLLESSPDEVELTHRLTAAACSGALTGGERKVEPVRIALLPTRADFVEMLCVVGYLRPNVQPYFWIEGLESWHQFNVEDMNMFGLAMEYPGDGVTGSTYSNGVRMEEDNENALGEQITQLALNSMLVRLYDDNLPATVIHSLSINMVIESFGEIDTRADGHLEGRSTQAREAFVPGGQSEGGILPTASAKNRWRYNQGRYYYLRPLRSAQKDGGKERGRSKIKHANFLLKSEDGAVRKLVNGPFLGSGAEPLPTALKGLEEDQAEFLRAYRIGFIHWLRVAGGGSKKASPEKFAAWLRDLDARASIEDFEESIETAYGLPLSSPELDKNCLEGRYLLWLSKQKSK